MNDLNGIELKIGDVIELFQTVNGQSKFVINSIDPLDISYASDVNKKYEYDMDSLLAPNYYTGEVEWEIVGSVIQEVEPSEEEMLAVLEDDEPDVDSVVHSPRAKK